MEKIDVSIFTLQGSAIVREMKVSGRFVSSISVLYCRAKNFENEIRVYIGNALLRNCLLRSVEFQNVTKLYMKRSNK